MQLAVERRADVSVVRLEEGKLTYPVLSSFFAAVQEIVDGGARRLVIDLKAVSYIDSASIGCLMDIHRILAARGGALSLSGLQSRVRTLLSMTGVLRILAVHRDEAEALLGGVDCDPAA